MATRVGNMSVGMSLNTKAFSEGLEEARRKAWKTIREIEKTAQMRIGELRGRMGSTWWQVGRMEKEATMRRMQPQFVDEQSGATRFIGRDEIASLEKRQLSLRGVAKAAALAATAIEVADIAADLLNKDFMAAAEKLKSLPFGIGRVTTKLEAMLGRWTGITAEIERQNSYLKLQESWTASIAKHTESVRMAAKSAADEIAKLKTELAIAGMEPGEAKSIAESRAATADRIAGVKDEMDARRKAAKDVMTGRIREADEYATSLKPPDKPEYPGPRGYQRHLAAKAAYDEAMKEADVRRNIAKYQYQQDLKVIAQQEQEKAIIMHDIGARNEEQIRLGEDRARLEREDKEREEARRAASELIATKAEGRALEMRLLKRDLDAELILIKERYRERIEEAKRFGKDDLAAQLTASRDAELRLARRGAYEPLIREMFGGADMPKVPTIMRGVSAFESLSLRNAPGGTVQQNMLKVAQEQKKVADGMDRKLQRLVDILERDDSEVVGIP